MKSKVKGKLLYKLLMGVLALLIVLNVLVVFGGILQKQEVEEGPSVLYEADDELIYSYVSVSLMSEGFKDINTNVNGKAHFVIDEENRVYIITVDENKEEDFQSIIQYTYDEELLTVPAPKNASGYSAMIDDDMKALAIDSFNEFLGEELITEDNFTDYFGLYYLDTTNYPDYSPSFFYGSTIVLAVFIAILLYIIYLNHKYKEIKSHEERIISTETEIYHDSVNSDNCTYRNNDNNHYSDSKDNTYRPKEEKEKIIYSDEPTYVDEKKENVFGGVTGAICGALIGGAIWVVLGQVGYLSGLSGLIAVTVAMKGYTLLGKKLSKKGIIFSIIISLLILFVANYISYTFSFLKAIRENKISDVEFQQVFKLLPDLLTEYDVWGNFITDYIIGLILSLGASYYYVSNIYMNSLSISVREIETNPVKFLAEYKGKEWMFQKSGMLYCTNERILFVPMFNKTWAAIEYSEVNYAKRILIFAVWIYLKDGSRVKLRITNRRGFIRLINDYILVK